MKKLILIAFLFALVSGAVFAQYLDVTEVNLPQLGVEDWKSPQNEATQGRFRSEADDFIRPDSYNSTGIESWYAMTSFRSFDSLNVGFAKQIKSLYLSAYYGGKGWGDIENVEYDEGTSLWVNNSNKAGVKSYDELPELGSPSHRFSLLVGILDMGFRFTIFSNYRSFSDEDFKVNTGPDYYKSYKSVKGSIAPEIVWSMAKDLTSENGLRPWAAFNINIYKDYSKGNKYTYTGGQIGNTGDDIARSQNITVPAFNLGAGGFTFYDKDDFKFSTDLEYGLVIASYNNEYTYSDNGKNKTGTIKGLGWREEEDTANPGDYIVEQKLTENSYSRHLITPSISGSYNGENLGLKFKFSAGVKIEFDGETNMTYGSKPGTLIKTGFETDTSVFGFSPKLELGANWQIVPKFALNVGGLINLDIERTTTEKKEYDLNGKEIKDSSETNVKTIFGKTGNGNKLSLGAVLKPAEYLIIEATSGITFNPDEGKTDNNISVFDEAKGLLFFYSVLVSLKF